MKGKSILFGFIYSAIFVQLLYISRGERPILFFSDVRYPFYGNKELVSLVAGVCILIAILCFYMYLSYKKIFQLKWDVQISKKHFCFGELKFISNHINKWIGLGGLVVIALGVLSFPENRMNKKGDVWIDYPVAHAMGAIDGITYTNSLDAFEENYAKGHRVFEVDFCITSDNRIVCRHDWKRELQDGINENNIPTEDKFNSIDILDKYEALTLKELLQLMKEYEDIYIITDSKSGKAEVVELWFKIFMDTVYEVEAEDVLDRIIVQIYNNGMLDKVQNAYEFPDIIYTLYGAWEGETETFLDFCRFCKNNNIPYITMWASLASSEVLEMADAYGITVFVHTVNDLNEAEELIERGVQGVYTDELTPDMFREE